MFKKYWIPIRVTLILQIIIIARKNENSGKNHSCKNQFLSLMLSQQKHAGKIVNERNWFFH